MAALDSSPAGFGQRLVPAGDPLEGATFDALYQTKIEPELTRREAERKRDVTIFMGGTLVALIAATGELAFMGAKTPPVLLIGTVLLLGIAAYAPLAALSRSAKASVLQTLCGPIAIQYAATGGPPAELPTFCSMNLLPRPQSGAYTDIFSGRRGKADFSMRTAVLTQGSGRNRRTVFQGQLISLTTPTRRASTTVILRNSGWLSGFQHPSALKPVGLEDPRFNKEFVVYSSDQVEAREILTPNFMQQLLDLEAGFSGAHIRCAFIEAELMIALATSVKFDIGGMFTSLVQRSRVEAIARNLELLFSVIDAFSRA